MAELLKKSALLVVGVAVAGVVIAIAELIGHSINGFSPFMAAIIGYAAGSFGGSFLISRLGGPRMLNILLFVLLALLASYNLSAFPHPSWFAPVALFALAVGTFAGAWKRGLKNAQ